MSRYNLPHFSVVRSFRTHRWESFFLNQVVAVFTIGVINWVGILWWSQASIPMFQYNQDPFTMLGFYQNSLALFFLPVILCSFASTAIPVKVLILPSDVNVVTLGVGLYGIFSSQTGSYSPAFQAMFLGIYLMAASLFQNGIARRLAGIEGSRQELSVQAYEADCDAGAIKDFLSLDPNRSALGIWDVVEMGDGFDLQGAERGFEFHLGIYRLPTRDTNRSLISLIGYQRDNFGILKNEGSKTWFRGKSSQVQGLLDGVKLPHQENAIALKLVGDEAESAKVTPPSLFNEALAPTRNLIERFREQGEGVLASVALVGLALGVSYYFFTTGVINESDAVIVVVAVILSQVGRVALSRKRE